MNRNLLFVILFWFVIGMNIGCLIWLIRVLIIIQIKGIYVANEPNILILLSEIVFFIFGFFLSIFMTIRISIILLEQDLKNS